MKAKEKYAVRDAMELLKRDAPAYWNHVVKVILSIRYTPNLCGETADACTAGYPQLWRVIGFRIPPSHFSTIELAVRISHESRHYGINTYGQIYVIPHTCRHCGNLRERMSDAIYREDETLRSILTEQNVLDGEIITVGEDCFDSVDTEFLYA